MTEVKNFSWIVKAKNSDGKINVHNVSDPTKGYRQSWYKTPKSAMKKMQEAVNYERVHNSEIIEACCFTRSGKTF